MNSSIFFLIFLLNFCYCEELLGGWSKSDDDSLKRDCLNRALVHLHGDQLDDQIKSEVSDLKCHTQIVNGLNIKCQFILRGQKWQCSYYKSFVQTLETQLEQCKKVEEEEKDDEPGVEDQGTANEDDKVEQPLIAHENEEEQQPAVDNEGEKEKQAVQGPPSSNEDDDEAKIDVMNNQMLKQNVNNNEEEQQH
jgi:hypothetical protein